MLETLAVSPQSRMVGRIISLEERRLEFEHEIDAAFEILAEMVRLSRSLKPGTRYVPGNPNSEEPLVNISMINFYKTRLEMLKATSRGSKFFEKNPRARTELESAISKLEGYFIPEKAENLVYT